MEASFVRKANLGRGAAIARSVGLVLAGALAGCATQAPPGQGVASAAEDPVAVVASVPHEPVAERPDVGDRGWGYLVEKLASDGVPREVALGTVQDSRFEEFDGLYFRPNPRESKAMYRNFLKPASVARARSCRAEHASAFERAAERERVPAGVLAAILHVETGCGANTGDEVVLYRLARLAMANEPANLDANIRRNAGVNGRIDPDLERRTRERGKYLEDLFYPEVLATFEVARRMNVAPLDVTGSGAGAFGYPQFLPTSFLKHGVDGNGDGRVDLYDHADAAASAARYLAQHGWKPGISRTEQRKVIWYYNRSDAYIDAVLGLADRLEPKAAPEKKAPAKARPASGTRSK